MVNNKEKEKEKEIINKTKNSTDETITSAADDLVVDEKISTAAGDEIQNSGSVFCRPTNDHSFYFFGYT